MVPAATVSAFTLALEDGEEEAAGMTALVVATDVGFGASSPTDL